MNCREWLESQRDSSGTHGMECVGVERLTQMWEVACAVEREACAKVCELIPETSDTSQYPELCAAAIRARK